MTAAKALNVILLGPQGAGKGTQAAALQARLGMVHIASGEVLRAAKNSGTELGRSAKQYMDAGELVPDEITIALLLEQISGAEGASGILLDGFPRTVAQAEALDAALAARGGAVDLAVELVAPLDTVRRRLMGRLTCRTCGAVYNVRSRPPKVAGVCDIDGGELYQREDDYQEAIDRRLAIWREQNQALTGHYEKRGILFPVDADRAPSLVTDTIVGLLERHRSTVRGG